LQKINKIKGHLKIKATIKQLFWLTSIIASLMAGCSTRLEVVNLHPEIPKQSPEFMLSFDDGPVPKTTDQVLDILGTLMTIKGTPVKAGFFLLADSPDEFWLQRLYYAPFELWTDKGSIAKYPEIARRILQSGHVIGNHTTHHVWFNWPWLDTPEVVTAEFKEWEAISKLALGTPNTHLFRPPYLILSNNLRETAEHLGYKIVLGETVGDAIPGFTVNEIKQKTESILATWNKPYPCLLIFHDNRPATFLNLHEIVSNLQQQGFRLVDFDPKRM
jgi:peptidoglycan/xylan/chitin deacetylase (PgdA/CDA1 family)